MLGFLVASAGEPSLGELILAGDKPAERGLLPADVFRHVALTAHDLAAKRGRAVAALLQRLPSQRNVDGLKLRPAPQFVGRRAVGPSAVGEAEVEVGCLREIREDS